MVQSAERWEKIIVGDIPDIIDFPSCEWGWCIGLLHQRQSLLLLQWWT